MTDRELDGLMRRVLLDSLKLDWERKLEPGSFFAPSASHKRQIRAMLADPLAWAHKKAVPLWKRTMQRAAVVLLILSLGFGGLLAASPTVRAAFQRWIVELYETHIVYRYTGKDLEKEMPRYEITDLPEGYAAAENEWIEFPGIVELVYRNEETGKEIYFDYVYMEQGFASAFVPGNSEVAPVTVNGLEGQFFWTEDWENIRNAVTWIDPEANLQFTLEAHLSEADILRMAESVTLDADGSGGH